MPRIGGVGCKEGGSLSFVRMEAGVTRTIHRAAWRVRRAAPAAPRVKPFSLWQFVPPLRSHTCTHHSPPAFACRRAVRKGACTHEVTSQVPCKRKSHS